ncbi:hypothetical protein LOC68_15240 [Blastopirellula sp. JC732]|uniref:MORN repeat variant n=1 Tax=Blastopirellula sediminis TaxID=2894196 RepID=A0A9X1SGU2_9BACT|nr:hypothetical protein [Blastopirellula sediminis]MCC9606962.1 hypothetical protein [Blastopirellula sediminis]MCC9629743.1 hypothetical protein [Blastopirellula sediminis]
MFRIFAFLATFVLLTVAADAAPPTAEEVAASWKKLQTEVKSATVEFRYFCTMEDWPPGKLPNATRFREVFGAPGAMERTLPDLVTAKFRESPYLYTAYVRMTVAGDRLRLDVIHKGEKQTLYFDPKTTLLKLDEPHQIMIEDAGGRFSGHNPELRDLCYRDLNADPSQLTVTPIDDQQSRVTAQGYEWTIDNKTNVPLSGKRFDANGKVVEEYYQYGQVVHKGVALPQRLARAKYNADGQIERLAFHEIVLLEANEPVAPDEFKVVAQDHWIDDARKGRRGNFKKLTTDDVLEALK